MVQLLLFPCAFSDMRTLTEHDQVRPLWERWNSPVSIHIMFGCMRKRHRDRMRLTLK